MRWIIFFITVSLWAEVNVPDLVRRSVAASERNWKESPHYVWTERDVEEKLDSRGRVKTTTLKVYETMILEGSEYHKLLQRNGQPLSPEELKAEESRLEAERLRRQREPEADRAKRIAKYQRERQQDRAMLREMGDAFTYKLAGEAAIDGHECYVLDATPKPGYVPKTRDTKVLPGMRGKMWVDKQTAQWVKVEAEVIRPVSFYAVASVGPGTKFILEQEPVGDGVWMPRHFAVKVNASILFMSRNTSTDEVYSNYRRAKAQVALGGR